MPDTVLVPYKNPLDNVRWAYTSERYNDPFDLGQIAHEMGYPLFMKPFDGGGWRGVSKIRNDRDLWDAYNESGEMLMHLQKSVEPYDVFARALTIGPETMVRASSLAFQLMVPPCVAITRRSNFAPCFLKRSLTFFSVWREGSAA